MNSVASNTLPAYLNNMTDLGSPVLNCQEMHIRFHDTVLIDQPVQVGERGFIVSAISFGQPMIVLFVPDFNRMDCEKIGAKLSGHALLHHPHIVFVQIYNRKNATIGFYDAGKGCTEPDKEAYGAALVVGAITHRLNRNVTFIQPDKKISAEWSEENNHVYINN
ncbi:MAG: hypothetical protein ACRCX4_14615 [Bacteroidales bacterium]